MSSLSRAFVPVGALALLFSEILLIAACFLVATLLVLNVDPYVFLLSDSGLWRIALAGASIVFGLYFEDLYRNIYVKSRVLLLQQLLLVMGIALVVQGILGYVNDGLQLPLRLMVPACAVLVTLLFLWRVAYSVFVLRVVGPQRILLVGTGPLLAEMAGYVAAHPELGLKIIGHLSDADAIASLPRIAAELSPDRMVVGFAERREQMPIADLLQLRFGGAAIDEASAAYEQLRGRIQLSDLRPSDILLSGKFRPRPQRLVYQSIVHGSAAFALSILSAPLMVLAVVLLRLSSRGPLLRRQKCIGFHGHEFALYSLRSGEKPNGVGRFVTRWRLDRLPHLWNIVRGEMCFVGPRAERCEFAGVLADRIPFYRQRYALKPGLTGWAQINQDRPEDTLGMLEYDLYYLKYCSRGLDAYILVHSVRELLFAG